METYNMRTHGRNDTFANDNNDGNDDDDDDDDDAFI